MERQVKEMNETTEMTDTQAMTLELLSRFYELQKAIDRAPNDDAQETLTAQKKKLIEKLEAR